MKKCFFLLFLLLNFSITFGQLGFCTGSSGAPIFFENFGSGTNYGPALANGVTNYLYVNSGFPQDGEYTLFYRTNLIPNNWHFSLDHTPDNQQNGFNGKCLIVNASNTPGQFYERTVTGLCSNTRFEFSAWLINILNTSSGSCSGTGIPINVTFEIWDSTDTVLIQSGNTGNINGTTSPIWNQFGLVFTMGAGQTSVILKMRNNGVGGCGNDLAIDDIMFRACGEFSAITNAGNAQNSVSICENETLTNNILNITTAGTATNVYQWQESNNAVNYIDIAGETNTTYAIPSVTSTTYYRVKVANDVSNLSNSFCSTLSEIFTVNINPLPGPPVSNGDKTLCGNQPTLLTVTANANESVNWYDAATNGNLLQSNSLSYSPTVAGTYYAATFNTLSGCRNNGRTAVKLLPKTSVSFSGNSTICSTETTLLTLISSDANAIINWTATATNVTGFSNGTGNTIQQTLVATGTTAGNVVYTITPVVNGCEGEPLIITVMVNTQTNVTPNFNVIPTFFCLNSTAQILPTSSTNSTPILGTWNPPTIDTTVIGNTIYTFIPQPNACISYVPYNITITVGNNLSPDFNANISVCLGSNPPLLNATSPNGISGIWTPSTIDNLVGGSYLFTPSANQCAVAQTINIAVISSSTTVSFAGATTICSTETTFLTLIPSDANAIINWTAMATNVTGFSNGTGNTIQQTLTTTGSSTGTVIYRITPTLNGCDGIPFNITVSVNEQTNVTPNFNSIPTSFCLNATAQILPTSSINNTPILGTWNPPTIDTTAIGNTIYTFIPTTNACFNYAQYAISITIIDNFRPDFDDSISFCSGTNAPLLNTTSPVGISGTWNPPTIDNQVSGSYLFTPDGSQCAITQTIDVTVFKPSLKNVAFTTSLAFSENQTITVLATDSGDYLYQLDNGSFQSDSTFSNVNAGFHTVTVADKNGCSPSLSENVIVVNYPNYFTPNGDGFNDFWNIIGLINLKNIEITVFDRYGKVISQIAPNKVGWDGTLNGNNLPADDYWFVINFEENNVARTFKSHFSLVR